jgi:hypothetical protein
MFSHSSLSFSLVGGSVWTGTKRQQQQQQQQLKNTNSNTLQQNNTNNRKTFIRKAKHRGISHEGEFRVRIRESEQMERGVRGRVERGEERA